MILHLPSTAIPGTRLLAKLFSCKWICDMCQMLWWSLLPVCFGIWQQKSQNVAICNESSSSPTGLWRSTEPKWHLKSRPFCGGEDWALLSGHQTLILLSEITAVRAWSRAISHPLVNFKTFFKVSQSWGSFSATSTTSLNCPTAHKQSSQLSSWESIGKMLSNARVLWITLGIAMPQNWGKTSLPITNLQAYKALICRMVNSTVASMAICSYGPDGPRSKPFMR